MVESGGVLDRSESQMASSSDRTAELHFPEISITRTGNILVHRGREALERGYIRMLRRGWYTGMRIIDIGGHEFKVVGARNLGGYGPFWGFSLQLKAMARSPHLWEASEEGLSVWRSKVRGAGSIAEIVEILESSGTAP